MLSIDLGGLFITPDSRHDGLTPLYHPDFSGSSTAVIALGYIA
jgi:hypothetical protein